MLQPDILVYTHEWHRTSSDAFLDLVVQPLSPYARVSQQTWNAADAPAQSQAGTIVFCEILASIEWLKRQRANIIWIPMWDEIRNRPQAWWNRLPKSLRIIAFSKAVAIRARRAGLRVLEVQYFKNPADFAPTQWNNERVLFYWNRRGMISPEFLERFCGVLKIDRLLFRPEIDPYVDDSARYALPQRLGNTVVETITATSSREAYWKLVEPANIVIAPRLHEGAGMVFLEQMARGCAVFANHAPTMSEYITQSVSGYFFRRGWTIQRLQNAIVWRLALRGIGSAIPFMYHLSPERQNWKEIASLDLETIGRNARNQQREGYRRWQASIPEYARFILDQSPR